MRVTIRCTRLWWALVGLIAAWLLWMTLRPNPAVANDLAPLTEAGAAHGLSPRVLIGLAGNVAVFVPLGLALARALMGRPTGRRVLLATLIGAAFSLTIEVAQSMLPSRVMALDDWLLNTVGTAIGALVGSRIDSVWERHR